jgi:hypothetical protein
VQGVRVFLLRFTGDVKRFTVGAISNRDRRVS